MDDEGAAAGEEALEPGRHDARRGKGVGEARADPARVPQRGTVPGSAALEDGDLGATCGELVGAAEPDDPASDDRNLHRRTLQRPSGRAADSQAVAGARRRAGTSTGMAVPSAALASSASSVYAPITDSASVGTGRGASRRGGESLELQPVRIADR